MWLTHTVKELVTHTVKELVHLTTEDLSVPLEMSSVKFLGVMKLDPGRSVICTHQWPSTGQDLHRIVMKKCFRDFLLIEGASELGKVKGQG